MYLLLLWAGNKVIMLQISAKKSLIFFVEIITVLSKNLLYSLTAVMA